MDNSPPLTHIAVTERNQSQQTTNSLPLPLQAYCRQRPRHFCKPSNTALLLQITGNTRTVSHRIIMEAIFIPIFTAVLNGLTGPFTTPAVGRGERWYALRSFRKRYEPAIICPNGRMYQCAAYKLWLPTSIRLLEDEGWLESQFREPTVQFDLVAPVLHLHEYLTQNDLDCLRPQSVTILGARTARERLAILLAAAATGLLRRQPGEELRAVHTTEDSESQVSTLDASFVTCQSEVYYDAEGADDMVDGVVHVRAQAQHDWCGYCSSWGHAGAAFGASEPHEGLPVSMSKVVIKLEMEYQCRPRFKILVPWRTIRDFGRFLHDPRGCFGVQIDVAARIYTPLGEVRSVRELLPLVRDHVAADGGSFASLLCESMIDSCLEDLLFFRICYDSDHRFHRPARIPDWDKSLLTGLDLSPVKSLWWQLQLIDAEDWRFQPRSFIKDTGPMFFNRNQQLTPLCREFLEVLRFLGLPIEAAVLNVGQEAGKERSDPAVGPGPLRLPAEPSSSSSGPRNPGGRIGDGKRAKAKPRAVLSRLGQLLPSKASNWLARHRRRRPAVSQTPAVRRTSPVPPPPAVPLLWLQNLEADWEIYLGEATHAELEQCYKKLPGFMKFEPVVPGEATQAELEQCYKKLPEFMKLGRRVWFERWHESKTEWDGPGYVDESSGTEWRALGRFGYKIMDHLTSWEVS